MKRFYVVVAAALIVAATLLLARHDRITPQPSCEEDGSCPAPAQAGEPASETPPSAPLRPVPAARAARAPANAASEAAALRAEADGLMGEGKVEEGMKVFRKAVEADPSAKNHGDFGRLLYRLTAFDEAVVQLRAAAELDPNNADRWLALANAYYRKVDLGEAWKAEKQAREAEPGLELGRDGDGMRVRKGESAPREP